MGLIISYFYATDKTPSEGLFSYNNMGKLIVFILPFIVIMAKGQFGNIAAIILGAILGFAVTFLLLWGKCKRTANKSPNNSKIATLSIPLSILLLVYGIALFLSPFFGRTPMTKIISILVDSILGSFVIGLVAAFVIFWPIVAAGNYCDDVPVTA